MANGNVGKSIFYRIITALAVTLIIGQSKGWLTGEGMGKVFGIFIMLLIPFIGFKFIKPLKLWQRILIALIVGLVAGVIAREMGIPEIAKEVQPVGTFFINMIKMLIVPLVLSTLVVGAASTGDLQKLGRIGGKTIALYLVTTAVAVAIGLLLGAFFKPGTLPQEEVDKMKAAETEKASKTTQSVVDSSFALMEKLQSGAAKQDPQEAQGLIDTWLKVTGQVKTIQDGQKKDPPTLVATLLALIPVAAVKAMSDELILQVIVFAIFVGICITMAKQKGKPVLNFFESLAEIMFEMTAMVMEFAPYGVYALIAWVAGQYGLSVLMPLMKVIVLVYVGCILHALITYGTIVSVAGMSPLFFFKGIFDAMMVAFTTCSSNATLPVNMRCTQENLGVSKQVASFCLPLGATINMDGTALYQGVCALFIAQIYGIQLTFGQYITIILTATLASIGTAGVPGAGLIMLTLVLRSVGLPMEGVALIAGVDRILDMARTTVNITGDAACSTLVAKTEGELIIPKEIRV